MRKTRTWAAVFLILLASRMPAQAEDLAPWRYVQALQALQDKIAHGDARAYAAQRGLMAYMGRQFAAMPVGVWKQRRNAEALFVYLLSGGMPMAAGKLLKTGMMAALPAGALEGAVAFARGRNGLAWSHLAKLDDSGLSITARTQLALTRASLRAAADPDNALRLLDAVRLLKPGTLQEEAALRRSVFIAGSRGEAGRFRHLSSAYMRRFADSWYAAGFLRTFAGLLARLDAEERPFLTKRMLPVIRRLSARQRKLVFAASARTALLLGKPGLARAFVARAMPLAAQDERLLERLALWKAAADAASPSPQKAMKRLRALRADALPPPDRKLRVAALLIGEAIMREPRIYGGKPRTSMDKDIAPVLMRARAMIAGVNAMLKKGMK